MSGKSKGIKLSLVEFQAGLKKRMENKNTQLKEKHNASCSIK